MSQNRDLKSLMSYLDGDGQRSLERNPEPRCPCVLLLDTSGSMEGESIKELEAGVQLLREELNKDKLASLRVELACVTFGGSVAVAHNFAHPDEFAPPALTASGRTPMGEAIHTALDLIEVRREQYRANDLDAFKSWAFLITDGEPTDAQEKIMSAAKRIRQGEQEKWLAFFAVGVERANMEKLAELSARKPLKLKGLEFAQMFQWVSRSLSQVSRSMVGANVALIDPIKDGWAEV